MLKGLRILRRIADERVGAFLHLGLDVPDRREAREL